MATKKAGGVIFAVEVMCPSTSRTDHPAHSDGVAHCPSVTVARSSARASRSLWINGHGSAIAIAP